jgi:outer membrane protein OmpA-like peptidoglycan-associated protein
MGMLVRLSALLFLLAPSMAVALSPWMVFFGHGSARIPTQFTVTLDHVAAWHRNTDIRMFRVTGFTDTSGSTEANMRLAMRRAEAVKAAMAVRGIPPEIIHVEAKGEATDGLLVETGDGVAHLENRRVGIMVERMCRPPPENLPVC